METKNLICFHCKHYKKIAGGCDAFPDGIPDEILLSNKHDKPLQEQKNTIIFEAGEPQQVRAVTHP